MARIYKKKCVLWCGIHATVTWCAHASGKHTISLESHNGWPATARARALHTKCVPPPGYMQSVRALCIPKVMEANLARERQTMEQEFMAKAKRKMQEEQTVLQRQIQEERHQLETLRRQLEEQKARLVQHEQGVMDEKRACTGLMAQAAEARSCLENEKDKLQVMMVLIHAWDIFFLCCCRLFVFVFELCVLYPFIPIGERLLLLGLRQVGNGTTILTVSPALIRVV